MERDEAIALTDYRRQVHEQYASVRSDRDPAATWHQWRLARDLLFRTHPASALEPSILDSFAGLPYFDYTPGYRFEAQVEPTTGPPINMANSGRGSTTFVPVGTISLAPIGIDETLLLYWLDGYGDGLFLPFRDATAGESTYGGGRYLLDTVKGADLGAVAGSIVIDFNYAYHPSCVHNPSWSCPLAPRANHLQAAINAGERLASG